jgi:hypothetical protein
MITLYNTKTERVPRYSNSPSINLWNCPSPIRDTVKPIDSYKTSGQDAFLVRETQGGSHPTFEQVGTCATCSFDRTDGGAPRRVMHLPSVHYGESS